MGWENLNKMYNLRKFYMEIAPPFSRDSAPRIEELERLNDDILYHHVRTSWVNFGVWVLFTVFILDFDEMDAPTRHFMSDDQEAHDFLPTREGYLI